MIKALFAFLFTYFEDFEYVVRDESLLPPICNKGPDLALVKRVNDYWRDMVIE